MSKPPIKRVSETELRKMFNAGKYWEQTRAGKLRAREPICTRSQYIIYVNNKGQKVAGVHQYLRPNGKLGASGRPDPKELFVNGILYILEK